MKTLMAYVQKNWVWLLANVGGLLPLALLLWGIAGGRWVDPVAEITALTGLAALILLIASLAVTPVNTVFGWRQIIPARKPLGLYAFGYAALHLLNFIGLDYGFSLDAFLADALLEKRFMIVGFSAFLILLPLAITSTKGWMKRLGRNWKRLHQLVYVAAVLAVLHFFWLVKIDIRQPLLYGAILAVLLLLRLRQIRQFFSGLRTKAVPATARKATPRERVAKAVVATER